jgi:hypothetical protein
MVYSAITEAQALRRFKADAAEAQRDGYVPVAQSWDRTTLTVTYERLDDVPVAGPSRAATAGPGVDRLGSKLMRRLGLA